MVYLSVSRISRGLKMLPHYLIEGGTIQADTLQKIVKGVPAAEGAEAVAGKGLRNFGHSWRVSMLKAEEASKLAYGNGSVWKYIKNAIKAIPGEITGGWSAGMGNVAKDAGKLSKFWGGIKGAGGAIWKRMPFIGTALWALSFIPNIFKATKEAGIATGAGEALKAVGSMTGFTAGFALGQALIPIPVVGGIIGGLVVGGLTDKILGKSYTEKKAQMEQEAAEKAQVAVMQHFDTGSTNPFVNLTPEQQYQLAMMTGQRA